MAHLASLVEGEIVKKSLLAIVLLRQHPLFNRPQAVAHDGFLAFGQAVMYNKTRTSVNLPWFHLRVVAMYLSIST